MILTFNIEYRTSWGEDIRVAGSIPELGARMPGQALQLHTIDGIHWMAEVEIEVPQSLAVHYCYQVYRDGQLACTEWEGVPRILHLDADPNRHYHLQDWWKNLPEQQYFYTSAFTQSLMAHPQRQAVPAHHRRGLVIKAYAPCVDAHHCIGICGNQPALGNWNPEQAVWMSDADFPEWQAEIDLDALTFPVEYKFVLYNRDERRVVAWEANPNRILPDPALPHDSQTLVVADRYVFFSLPEWRGAGVAVPVFSLRSTHSWGVGDFGDLRRMIDWAVLTHQKVVQILPINDTTMTHTWTDSYPYSSISIYAFHPMYLDMEQLPRLADEALMAGFEQRRQQLNALPAVDYEAVNQLKWDYLRQVFAQEGEQTLQTDGFARFFADNEDWLRPYAVFSYLRDAYQTPDFRQWPRYSTYQADEIAQLCQPGTPDYPHIALYYYIQYHLHLQLLAASRHARSHGVVLKGDIPIGISRNSVEAWAEPHYFNLNGQAGAPPDDFSVNGQNWGLPTYNWDVMQTDGYAWWKRRFRKMAEYFDAYRIDHILGFFRIWEIPLHAVHGLLGQFVPSLPLSRQDIENYGLHFRDEFLQPYIHEYFLEQIFGPHTDYVRQTFLQYTDTYEVYRLKPEFDTQRKIEAYFAGRTDADSIRMRDGLYALVSDVLFVPDRQNPHLYHPRIAVQHDFVYRSLNYWEQAAFNRLYDDYYYHRHDDFWYWQAMQKLPSLIASTSMLVCGEDLGMIPHCVPAVMNDLRILSLEIERMPKDPTQEFGTPAWYPYRSVSAISTHDMSTLRGWWEEDPQRTQRYYAHQLGHGGPAPAQATPQLCEEMLARQLGGRSMLCILSLQDWMSIDGDLRLPDAAAERINVPANPRHYWRYRMHLSLEQLMQADALNGKIKSLIANTGRETNV